MTTPVAHGNLRMSCGRDVAAGWESGTRPGRNDPEAGQPDEAGQFGRSREADER